LQLVQTLSIIDWRWMRRVTSTVLGWC
jgi:hypothetical protein